MTRLITFDRTASGFGVVRRQVNLPEDVRANLIEAVKKSQSYCYYLPFITALGILALLEELTLKRDWTFSDMQYNYFAFFSDILAVDEFWQHWRK